jgi:triacylglycerol lipase
MNLVFASGFFFPQRLAGKEYFRGVRAVFDGACFPLVPPVGDVQTRASALAHQINDHFPQGPIHIVAHSMGGLDARFVLSNNMLGLANSGRVISLSTISTPHRGSAIADLIVAPEPSLLDPRRLIYLTLQRLAAELKIPTGALGNLTTGFAAKFGCPNVQHVRYFSYAASGNDSFLLTPSHLYLMSIGQTADDQANDGLVTLTSAALTPLAEPAWTTDHYGEVGYNLSVPTLESSFDHIGMLRKIIARAAPNN